MASRRDKRVTNLIAIGVCGMTAAAVCVAVPLGLRRASRLFDRELIESTEDVGELIAVIYDYRKSNGAYPSGLNDLDTVAREKLLTKDKNRTLSDHAFWGRWRWSYMSRGPTPPIIVRDAGSRTRLRYEFTPSVDRILPADANEGWVSSSDGSVKYLKSFFSGGRQPFANRDTD